MTDLTTDDKEERGALYSVGVDRSPAAMSSYPHRLLRLIWWLGVLAAIVFVVVWLVRVQASLRRLEGRVAVSAIGQPAGDMNTARSPEVQALEARLSRVLTASVESKLRRLEHSVDRGTLGGEDLQLLEAVAGELRLLRSQPSGAPDLQHGEAMTEHPRYRSVAAVAGPSRSEDVLQQVGELRTFVYIVVVCLALFLTLALGLWYSTARRVRMIATAPRRQLASLKTPHGNRRGI
jgi:hypothetical protein